MASTDSKREFAVDVVRRLQQAGYVALWAGGCVRDLLQGHDPSDYDVATNARPEAVRQVFGPRQTIPVGVSFGVIIVRGSRAPDNVEVATFRTEGPYLDGRRPEHVTFSTPEEDAQRRDFTINGMFFDPLTGNILDFVGGRQDLERGVIRAIGNPGQRFTEDKLRMLRAVRFSARFDYRLDGETADAIRGMAREMLIVSPERITQELKKMLVHGRRALAVDLARDVGLLPVILPELTPLFLGAAGPTTGGATPGNRDRKEPSEPWRITLRMLEQLPDPSFELALAALLHETLHEASSGAAALPEMGIEGIERLCRRLRLSNKELEQATWLLKNRHALRQASQLPLSRLKRILAHPRATELLTLNRVAAVARQVDVVAVEFCEQFLRTTPREEIDPPPLLTGDDLIQHGLPPGAEFKQLLEQVRDAQLEGTVRSRDEALQWVDRRRP